MSSLNSETRERPLEFKNKDKHSSESSQSFKGVWRKYAAFEIMNFRNLPMSKILPKKGKMFCKQRDPQ